MNGIADHRGRAVPYLLDERLQAAGHVGFSRHLAHAVFRKGIERYWFEPEQERIGLGLWTLVLSAQIGHAAQQQPEILDGDQMPHLLLRDEKQGIA